MGFQDFPFESQIKVNRSVPIIRGKLIRKLEPKRGDLFDSERNETKRFFRTRLDTNRGQSDAFLIQALYNAVHY